MSYAQPLRAIGQALEVLNVQDFEMETAGEEYIIRGRAESTGRERSKQAQGMGKIRAVWGAIPDFGFSETHKGKTHTPDGLTPIELRYTPQDVERLESEGRTKRGHSETAANAPNLSQVLRSIGGYLNKKSAKLHRVTRELESVTIEYQTSSGSRMTETFSVQDLYDLWVGMYLQRAERASH